MPKDIGDNSEVQVDFDAFVSQLTLLRDKKSGVSQATGALRSEIKAVLDQTGFHKSALAIIRQIDDMNQTARADFLRSFDPLFNVMMSKKWADEMQDLFEDETQTEPKE